MKRPQLPDDSNIIEGVVCNKYINYINKLESYCDFLEKDHNYLEYSINMLEAYLEDSIDRVNPLLDEDYIDTVKEILR